MASVPAISYGESTAMVAGNEAAAAGLAALARKSVVALLDSELPPLPTWSTAISFLDVAEVAEVAEVAVVTQELSRRRAIAFDVARHWRRDGYLFSFLAFDGAYGHLPWLPGELDRAGETFLVEIHPDRAVYFDEPRPVVSDGRSPWVRASLRLREKVEPTSVVAWMSAQPTADWRRLLITGGGNQKRKLRADYLTRRVWIWDGKSASAGHWHLLVRREMDGETLSFCLSNAKPDASLRQLADMQERAISSRARARVQKARTTWLW
ncbi:hypothetical protein [Accumulibacter sp.]|uniref:hypothetical protein n=1 Tax=Accumulibacter sp. TaxID=2053492 RepID=UPI002CA52D4D|nr:hypothetical protein [Accumulibacter sp.]HRF06646.1 hypothetical protein [Accumulibacter sp.]